MIQFSKERTYNRKPNGGIEIKVEYEEMPSFGVEPKIPCPNCKSLDVTVRVLGYVVVDVNINTGEVIKALESEVEYDAEDLKNEDCFKCMQCGKEW